MTITHCCFHFNILFQYKIMLTNIYKSTVTCQVKTTQLDGLVMFSGELGSDFLAIELVAGHIRYSYDVGNRPRSITDGLRLVVSDNQWHDVSVLHPTLTQHILRVDNTSVVDTLPDARSVHFDMVDDFYIGGVVDTMYATLPKQVSFTAPALVWSNELYPFLFITLVKNFVYNMKGISIKYPTLNILH